MSRRYLLIAPSRDEAATMRRTLDDILAQTVPPAKLIVVDDGSTDATPEILREYQAKMPYLDVVTRSDRGVRKVGGGVIEAFKAGLATVDLDDYEFVCKVDTDLELPAGYFEGLIAKMDADPHLGSCSGKPYYRAPGTGELVSEHTGDETSVGMTKFYRTACFREIGGFVQAAGWDTIDCYMCRMRGWRTLSFDDEPLRFIHLRPMGSSHISLWHGRIRHGRGLWFLGTIPLYMLAVFLYRLNKPPVGIGALGMLWGYAGAMLSRQPRFDAPGYRAFVRRYQLRALVVGKARAAEESVARGLAARQAAGPDRHG